MEQTDSRPFVFWLELLPVFGRLVELNYKLNKNYMILPIIHYPDPILKQVAKPVEKIDNTIINLIGDMFDTMKVNGGCGLAAPQIGQSIQLAVVKNGPHSLVLINPLIEKFGGGSTTIPEGCLSIPNKQFSVTRRNKIIFSCLNENGLKIRLEANGMFSRIIQHEIDHLNGILIIDK